MITFHRTVPNRIRNWVKDGHRIVRYYSLVAIVLCISSLAEAADWPTHRNNLRRNAVSREPVDAAQLNLTWVHRASTPPLPAWHGPAKWDAYANLRGLRSMRDYDSAFHPIAVGDSVYFSSSGDDSVTCLDRNTGELRWRFFTDAPVRVAPTFWDGRLFFGADDGYAYCVNASTGEEIWKYRPVNTEARLIHNGRLISYWPIRTGIAIHAKTAYFAASLVPWKPSYLCAIDADSGKPISVGHYVKELKNLTLEGPLVTSSKLLISPQGRVPPMLFRMSDGKALGEIGVAGKSGPKNGGGGGSFVVVTDDDRVVHGPGNKAGWLTRTNMATRERIATHQSGRGLVVAEGISYLITEHSVSAVDYEKDKKLWQTPCENPSTLIAVGDSLIVGKVDEVASFSRIDGKQLWSHPVAGDAIGLAFANGSLLVSTTEGNLYSFQADGSALGNNSPEMAALRSRTEVQEAIKASKHEDLTSIREDKDRSLVSRWVFPASSSGAPKGPSAGRQHACDD